jgi:predicted ATP-dependent endonuclease of OLD family
VLERLIGQLVPDFTVELRGVDNPPYIFTRVATQQPIGNIDEVSSGEAQLIMLSLDILTIAGIWQIEGREQRVMLIDEPDAHIHPDLQVRFADFLIQAATLFDLQIVVASHSTTLMAAIGQFGAAQASVLYLDRMKSEFSAEPFSMIMKELASCLGGHALMGPLFGVPLLLVEGDDDYRIWSQVPRHHVVNFAVIPSHGDEIFRYQKTLEKMFASLRDDGSLAGFALLDGDKGKPAANEHTPQNHVRFIQLACHEAENLYLTDEVLAEIGTNWVDACAKIVACSPSAPVAQI